MLLILLWSLYQAGSLLRTNAEDVSLIAFYCGRPAMVFRNHRWQPDFQQTCIQDEKKIVDFCKKSFPLLDIVSAEPSIEKVNFTNWCDFNSSNCNIKFEVRPFRCLDSKFQSDALTLPKDCKFAHLAKEDACNNYKFWKKEAEKHCSSLGEWRISTYGMLFPCKIQDQFVPMHFRGVEFVCCPKVPIDGGSDSSLLSYKDYLGTAILDSLQTEQKNFDKVKIKLNSKEISKEKKLVEDLKRAEKDLLPLWESDPNLAIAKENELLRNFKTQYKAVQHQFLETKNQLMSMHDDRLTFIFNTYLSAAKKTLKKILGDPNRKSYEVLHTMKKMLDILFNRKQQLLNEMEFAKKFKLKVSEQLSEEVVSINKEISQLFQKLDKYPDLKTKIGGQLSSYRPKITTDSLKHYEDIAQAYGDVNSIIQKFRHRSGSESGFVIHYDLGLNDPDQIGHYPQSGGSNFEHNPIPDYRKISLLATIFLGIGCVLVIMIAVSAIIQYRLKHSNHGYKKTIFPDSNSVKVNSGFGGYEESTMYGKLYNVHENPTYNILTTKLISATDVTNTGGSFDKHNTPLMPSDK